jgi:hypothetical protein
MHFNLSIKVIIQYMKNILVTVSTLGLISSNIVFAHNHEHHKEIMKISDEAFVKADLTKDGKLDKNEHMAFHEYMEKEMKAKKPTTDEMFSKSDINKDGFVTKEELKQTKETMGQKVKGEMKEIKKDVKDGAKYTADKIKDGAHYTNEKVMGE